MKKQKITMKNDTTLHKDSEVKIKEASKNWQDTFDAISDIIMLLTPTHEIIEINKAGLLSLNKTRAEIIGKKCYQLVHNSESPIKNCPCDISLIGKKVIVNEYSQNNRSYELTAWPVFDENNNIKTITHILKDITERKQLEDERLVHFRFFESMDQVNRVILRSMDLEQMMSNVLKTTLLIFDCDRSWLLYPCDPNAPTFRVPMEITKPEYLGAKVLNVDVPIFPDVAHNMKEALESDEPITYIAGTDRPINKVTSEQFGVQSQMFIPVYPKVGKPWVFGMHQCSYARVWTQEDKRLFQEIGRRLSDALSSLLIYRDLCNSEERYRLIAENTADTIAILDLDLNPRYISPSVLKLRGYTVQEAMDQSLDQVLTTESLQKAKKVLAEQMELEASGTADLARTILLELEAYCKNGSTIYVELAASFLRDYNSKLTEILTVTRDISIRKKIEFLLNEKNAEYLALNEELSQRNNEYSAINEEYVAINEELRKSNTHNRLLFDSSTIGLVLTKMTGELVDVNQAYADIINYTIEETLKLTYWDITPEKYAEQEKIQLDNLNKKGFYGPYEKEYIHKSGRLVPVRLSGRIIEKNGEKFIWSSVENITEQIKTQEAVAESEVKFRSIFEHSIDGIGVVKNGIICFANKALLSLINCKDENIIIGRRISELVLPEYKQVIEQKIINRQLGKNQEDKYEVKVVKITGEIIDIELHVSEYSQNNEKYVMGIIRDITEQKQAKQNMLKHIIGTQENERRKFAMELHDGLGPQLSAAKLYLKTYLKTTSKNKDLTALHKTIETIDEAINSVRDVSNNLSPQMLINLGVVDALGSFINKINESSGITISYIHNITHRIENETGITIYRIITELINNTIKYAEANNIFIEIKTSEKDGLQLFSMNYSDNGTGFNIKEILKESTGMGLTNIVSRIESLKGTYSFDNSKNIGMSLRLDFFLTSVAK